MSKSIACLHTHIVFSTKNREPFIHTAISNRLFGQIGLACHDMGCHPIQVGGWQDHVHVLCALSKKLPLMDIVKEIKVSSSHWFKDQPDGHKCFYWQTGYAAFSVSPKDSDQVVKYILRQKEHHANIGYQDECRQLFREQGLEFDERYFWD